MLKPLSLLFTETGSKIESVALLPQYFPTLIKETYGLDLPLAATHHLTRGVLCSDVSPYYLGAFFATNFGKSLVKISTYGSVKPEMNNDILKKVKIMRFGSSEEEWISDKVKEALETYEYIAWSNYLKTTALIEHKLPLPPKAKFFSSPVSFQDFQLSGRLDPKFLLNIKMIESLSSTEISIVKVKDWFEVSMGAAPRNRLYRRKKGVPYVTFESIEKSGILDDDKFNYIPQNELPNKMPSVRENGLLITCVAHDIRGIGKVGIFRGSKDMAAMNGLAILNPKPEANSSYAFMILKSKLMNRAIQNLTYGLTAQITKADIENLRFPVIKSIAEDVTIGTNSFLNNSAIARRIKKEALSRLENKLLEVL